MKDRTNLLRFAKTEWDARTGAAALLLILLLAGLCSAVSAYEKPLWYDEICTVILSGLPGASEIWKALDHAADTNPPFFYLVTRWTRPLILDEHLGYRLSSIFGLLVTIVCLYFIISRRVDRVSALVGGAFVLCTPLALYAAEARPYALLLACISLAILAWQRISDTRLYFVVLIVALASALSLHYYAILVWPAFVLAEASLWVVSRRFRIGVWLSLALGASPLFFFGSLLLRLREYYGQNFWARPGPGLLFGAPSYLFNFLGYWGWCFTIAAAVLLARWSLQTASISPESGARDGRAGALPVEECVFTVALLFLPVIAVAAAGLSGGGMTYRYMLPSILGGAMAVGLLTSKTPHPMRALLLVLVLMNFVLSSAPVMRKLVNGSLLERREAAVRELQALTVYRAASLPIVISSGIQFLRAVYYAPVTNRNVDLYALTDRGAALKFAKTDSVDLALLSLQHYFPLHVEDYAKFASRHREFILVSGDGSEFDWWPSRLVQDGHTLTLVATNGARKIFKVILKPE